MHIISILLLRTNNKSELFTKRGGDKRAESRNKEIGQCKGDGEKKARVAFSA